MDYKKNFPFFDAFNFLNENNFEKESNEIKNSKDKYHSYSATLRRAKIIALVKEKKILDKFCNSVWQSGLTDKRNKRIKFLENLFIRFKNEHEIDSDDEDLITSDENQFAYEEDLREYLIKNISKIENGLKIYEAENQTGREYYIPGTTRRVDILAIDKENNFVVIELKVNRGHEKVIGQVLYYQSKIKIIFKRERVRAIIIAKEITEEIKIATRFLSDVELFEYELSCTLSKINNFN